MGASGKTGRAVTGALAARGFRVRAAVRSEGAAESVYAAGAGELAVLDLETGAGLERALEDVWGVYHLAPNVHPDEVGMAERVTAAAEAVGARRLVFHSVLHPDDASMPHHLRKARAEEVVRTGGVPWTVLRPAAYHQNLVPAALAGEIAVPYSLDSPFTNVDLGDVALVAATVLSEPGHEGQVYDLAGPEVLTVREMAAEPPGRWAVPSPRGSSPVRAGWPGPVPHCRSPRAPTCSPCSRPTTRRAWSGALPGCGPCSTTRLPPGPGSCARSWATSDSGSPCGTSRDANVLHGRRT